MPSDASAPKGMSGRSAPPMGSDRPDDREFPSSSGEMPGREAHRVLSKDQLASEYGDSFRYTPREDYEDPDGHKRHIYRRITDQRQANVDLGYDPDEDYLTEEGAVRHIYRPVYRPDDGKWVRDPDEDFIDDTGKLRYVYRRVRKTTAPRQTHGHTQTRANQHPEEKQLIESDQDQKTGPRREFVREPEEVLYSGGPGIRAYATAFLAPVARSFTVVSPSRPELRRTQSLSFVTIRYASESPRLIVEPSLTAYAPQRHWAAKTPFVQRRPQHPLIHITPLFHSRSQLLLAPPIARIPPLRLPSSVEPRPPLQIMQVLAPRPIARWADPENPRWIVHGSRWVLPTPAGIVRGRFLPYLFVSDSVLATPERPFMRMPEQFAEHISHRIFSQKDAQGFVVPPPLEHFHQLQLTSIGQVAEPASVPKPRSPTPLRPAYRRGRPVATAMDLTLSLFPKDGPQISNFGQRPAARELNEWAAWNRFRGESLFSQRRGARLLLARKAIKRPAPRPARRDRRPPA
jgi:hypothetical protein